MDLTKVNWMKNGALLSIKKKCEALVKSPCDAVCVTVSVNGINARAWMLKSDFAEASADESEDITVRLIWDINDSENPPIYGKIPATLNVGGKTKLRLYLIPEEFAEMINS